MPLRTDIAGFVGIAERGPIGRPVSIETVRQFESIFGSYIGGGYLAYQVRAFFENGGRRCRVVRVASDDPEQGAIAASLDIPGSAGGVGVSLRASSEGSWGNGLMIALSPSRRVETLTRPGTGSAESSFVVAPAGFAAGLLVRLEQPGVPAVLRVVAAVDPSASRLYWIHPNPERRHPRHRVLTGFDPNLPIHIEVIEYDLLVRDRGRLVAVYDRLSLVPEAARSIASRLAAPDYERDDAVTSAPHPVMAILSNLAPDALPDPLAIMAGQFRALSGGRDGLMRLAPADFMGEAPDPRDDEARRRKKSRGLAALADAEDVSILAVPDILIQPVLPPEILPVPTIIDPCAPCGAPDPVATPIPKAEIELPPVFDESAIYQVQMAMIAQCEALRDRVALIDPPFASARDYRQGIAPVQAWRSCFDSAFGALYFPWLAVPDPLGVAPVRLVPPSGAVAGQMAATDLAAGVHKAAANDPLSWTQFASIAVDEASHGLLNGLGINVIRAGQGRALRILGARTLSSDPDYRFFPVRRLICMLRRALDRGTQWAVFEPNDVETRLTLTNGLAGFLTGLWRRGALAGTTPDGAFRIRCDEGNNPPSARANGKLLAEIAVAPSIPFEFIILKLGRQGQSLELVEDNAGFAPLVVGDA